MTALVCWAKTFRAVWILPTVEKLEQLSSVTVSCQLSYLLLITNLDWCFVRCTCNIMKELHDAAKKIPKWKKHWQILFKHQWLCWVPCLNGCPGMVMTMSGTVTCASDQMGFWDWGLRVWLVGCTKSVISLYKQTHVQNLLIYFIMMLYLATIWCCLPACNI